MRLFTKQNLQRLRTNTIYKKPKTEPKTYPEEEHQKL